MPVALIVLLVGAGTWLLYKVEAAKVAEQQRSSNADQGITDYLPMFNFSNSMRALAEAIAFAEGGIDANGNPTTNLPGRINNPGDLEVGDIGNGVTAGKTHFSSADPSASPSARADDGWARLYHQVQIIASGLSHFTTNMTLSTFAAYYVNGDPSKSNTDSEGWARNVASYLNRAGFSVNTGTQLGQILNA